MMMDSVKRWKGMCIKDYLDYLSEKYETPNFIEEDPINFPHRYTKREDIEIAGFLASIIAWGNRKMIVRNTHKMAELLGDAPYDFVMSATADDMQRLSGFVHRTFNGEDFTYFIMSLRNIYSSYGGLAGLFASSDIPSSLSSFYRTVFQLPAAQRTIRHISSIDKGSACKRLNMFLRWMVRSSAKGVDFGLWKGISPSSLYLPLDVHSANTSRSLGLLHRKQNDWKAVEEVTEVLRNFCPEDPIKYDFALFSAGIEKVAISELCDKE